MLKRFAANSRVSTAGDTADTLYTINNVTMPLVSVLTVPVNQECAIVTMDVQNLTSTSANLCLIVKRNNSVMTVLLYELPGWSNMLVDSKEFLEAGDELFFGSDKEGVQLSVSCDISQAVYD